MGMCFYMLFHIMCSRHHCWGMWPTAACSFPCMCLVPTGEATWFLQVAMLVVDWRYLRPKRISNDPFADQFLNPLWTSGGNRGNIFFKQDLSPEKKTIFLTANWYSRIWQISRCARSPRQQVLFDVKQVAVNAWLLNLCSIVSFLIFWPKTRVTHLKRWEPSRHSLPVVSLTTMRFVLLLCLVAVHVAIRTDDHTHHNLTAPGKGQGWSILAVAYPPKR